jgi:hypothetical protein
MQEKQFNLSAAQQSKLHEHKYFFLQQFPKSMLYQVDLAWYVANILNDDFAYL